MKKISQHRRRLMIAQNLYAFAFGTPLEALPNREAPVYETTKKIIQNLKEIDKFIKKYAEKLPFERIAKVDLSILRLGVYELLYDDNIPEKVAIDEAVSLAKELGAERAYAFVNAVLEKVYKSKNKNEKN